MRKRIVAAAAILLLIVFDASCLMYSIRKEPPGATSRLSHRDEVWAVMKKSKEYIEFSPPRRGRRIGDVITGLALQKTGKGDVYQESLLTIPLSEVEMIWVKGVDPLKTFLVNLGVIGAAVVVFQLPLLLLASSIGD